MDNDFIKCPISALCHSSSYNFLKAITYQIKSSSGNIDGLHDGLGGVPDLVDQLTGAAAKGRHQANAPGCWLGGSRP